VTVEDKQYKIDVTRTNTKGRYAVKIDDKPRDVELQETGVNNDQPLQFKIDDVKYTAQIVKASKLEPLLVKIKNISLRAEVKIQSPLTAIKSVEKPAQTPNTQRKKGVVGKVAIEGAVTAPMTGKIVAVRVKKGDSVKTGAILCVLEAMKMENEIVATRTGTVREVIISEGSTVNEGDTLVILE
jgi:biotin carboxyl carrier protein